MEALKSNYKKALLTLIVMYLIAIQAMFFIKGCANKTPALTQSYPAMSCSEAPDSIKSLWQLYDARIKAKEAVVMSPDVYILRFTETAKAEEVKYNVPAEITLAQGILESKYGTSRLCLKTNNHFGIKCYSRDCTKGHCINFSDDSHKDFFMCYKSAWESFRAHSLFLLRDNYKACFKCGDDLDCWANTLQERGYATSKIYAKKLKMTIRKYGLKEACK